MALNLNVSPYYDDFDDAKNFNRILFKPGYAVQARELTQLQTILQDQIGKFGNHVFKNGSVVTGCPITITSDRPYIKILDVDALSNPVLNEDLSLYIGDLIEGATSGRRAVILDVLPGSSTETPNYKTLYLRYISGDGSTDRQVFDAGETVTIIGGDRNGDTFVLDSTESELDIEDNFYGLSTIISVGDGIVYLDGKFVNHTKQELILGRYTPFATCKVGFLLQESISTAQTDSTLLDPAQGSFNYAAPGADRYTVSTTLVKYDSSETPDPEFNQLIDVVDGTIARSYSSNIYAELGKNLARRTFDESGNYTVRSFPILVKEHLKDGDNNGLLEENLTDPTLGGNPELLAIGLEAGKAYVRGWEYETRQTEYVIVPKGLATVNVQESPISTAYGNYILVDEMCGILDINSGTVVSLRDAAQGAVTDGTYSSASAPGSEIGTARVKQIVYESGTVGTASAQYRAYLYDVNVTSDFKNVRGVYFDDGDADFHADVVLDGSGNAVIYESNYNNSLFRMPARAIKTIAPSATYDNSFVYMKEIDGELNSNGQVTLTLSGNESFPYSTFTSTIINNNFFMVLKEPATINSVSRPVGSILDLTGAAFTKNNSQSITIDLAGAITVGTLPIGVKIYVNVQTANAEPIIKVLREDRYVTIKTNTHPSTSGGTYSLGLSDVYQIKTIKIGANTDSAATVESSGLDVTDQFTLDNGQRDTKYGNARIIKKASSGLSLTNKRLVVKLDYFTHDGTAADGNFFVVDSYPIDDTGVSSATIKTQNIPIYTSPVTGETWDLRDTLDFRVRIADTAANSTTPSGATENPTSGSTVSAPIVGITNPTPTEQFITDLEYYLGRKDRIVIDDEGHFSAIYGSPSLTPGIPSEPENAMSLAIVTIPPYPSLAPNVARQVGRMDYGVTFKTIDNRRYTMRDIGQLEQRINRLEYYTSLTLLEKAATDLLITDTSGVDRFKNGILVDAFTGHNVGNVFDSAYHCSIDTVRKELRPFFYLENMDLNFNQSQSTNVTVHEGGLVTLPYTHTVLTDNPFASKFRNCVGELLFNYIGEVTLDPPVDNWVDTGRAPDVAVNFDGNYDALENMVDAWGTHWEDWQDAGVGRVVESTATTIGGNTRIAGDTLFQEQVQQVTTTTEQRQTRQGVQLNITPEVTTQNMGTRVINTSIIPYMRSIVITFKANRLKPNTRIYPFFDGVAVSAHCRPLSSAALSVVPAEPTLYNQYVTGSYGDALVTDSTGSVVGQFRIPADTFRVGDKNFRLCDDPTNNESFITTSATQTWSASGLSQVVQDTVVSTRVANVTANTVSDSRSVFDTNTTTNRLADREVGVVQTTVVNNTFTTVNNTTNITNNTTNVTEVTNVTVVQPQPVCQNGARRTGEWHGNGNRWRCQNNAWVADDPIAQTFYISGMPFGTYITKLDVYFRTKSSTAPMTVQIREVVNGYPGNRIIPFGEVTLQPSQISVDANSPSAATTFTFPSPVYLQNNTEYCFVLMPAGNNPDYNVWVSELGENQVGTTERISEQPNIGLLFTSANNRTWTAWQSEDITFSLYRADFQIGTVGELIFNNFDVDYLRFNSFSNGNFAAGDTIHSFNFDITNGGTGYTDGTYSGTLSGGGATTNATVSIVISGGIVTSVSVVDPGAGYTGNPTGIVFSAGTPTSVAVISITLCYGYLKEYDSLYKVGKLFVETGTFSANTIVGNGSTYSEIVEVEDKIINSIQTNIGAIDHTPATLLWSYAATPTGATTASTTYQGFNSGNTHDLSYEAAVYSYSNEQAFSGTDKKSLRIRAGMITQTSTVSPVIDLRKCSLIGVRNDINNPTSLDETVNNGNSASKYITRRVVLDTEAEDLKVFLSNSIPTGADVKVYGKFLNVGDTSTFEDRPWVELENTSSPLSSTAQSGFYEYEYTIPDANKTAGVYTYTSGGTTYSGYQTFAVKVVYLSSSTSVVPRSKELRAIALMS